MPKPLWAPWRAEYVGHADEATGCIFCAPEPDLLIHRGSGAIVMLNRFPYTSGHLLIAPERHLGSLPELTDSEALELHRLSTAALAALSAAFSPDGFNLGWNLGRAAGAGIVDHIHLHVVPRWEGDTSFMPVLADVRVLPQALAETARRLRERWP